MPIYKRGGVYWLDFRFQGTRYRITSKTNKKEAQRALDRIMGRIASGDFDPQELEGPKAPEGVLFENALKLYLEHCYAKGRGEDSYRWIRRDWPKVFTGWPVRSITSEEIEARLLSWTEDRKLLPATRNQALAQLSGFLSYCYGRGWIDMHPTLRGRVPKLAVDNGRNRWLRLHEVEALIAAAPAWMKAALRFGVMTGMRLGEVCSLRRACYQEDGSGLAYVVTEQRTKNRERLVWPLEGPALGLVEQQLERISPFPAAHLFPGPGGKSAYTAIRRHFPDVARAAGLAYGRYLQDAVEEGDSVRWVTVLDAKGRRVANPAGVTFHTLRHSMASLALTAGIPENTVQRMGNWKTRTMVARYAHLADESLRAAAGKLASLVGDGHKVVTIKREGLVTGASGRS